MKTTKFPFILIASLITILGGYFVWTNYGDEIISRISPTPTPNPYAGWQTYTNEEYGFSIKFPKDWYDRGEHQDDSYYTKEFSYQDKSYGTIPSDIISITITNKLDQSTLWNSIEGEFNYFYILPEKSKSVIQIFSGGPQNEYEKIENFTIAGFPAYKVQVNNIAKGTELNLITKISVLANNKIYSISASNYDVHSDLPSIAEKMILSIQFHNL